MSEAMEREGGSRAVRIDLRLMAPAWKTAVGGRALNLRRAVRAALSAAGHDGPAELCLVLGDDALLRRLNRGFRGRDKATNVLSFPSGERPFLGDVLLAFETCAQEAEAQGKSLGDHAAHLSIHGALHLLGFDHEREHEASAMEALERRVLAGLGIADPYAPAAARQEPPR